MKKPTYWYSSRPPIPGPVRQRSKCVQADTAFEGVATRPGGTKARGRNATSGRGVVVFADSHPEARLDRAINPPSDGCLANVKYWDPELNHDR